MITNFEEITHELTPTEMELIPIFVSGLQTKIGKGNVVKNAEIISRLKKGLGITVSEARVRKIINYIRTSNLVPLLVATSSGYYVATDKEDVDRYIESLEQREREIRRVRESLKQQLEYSNLK